MRRPWLLFALGVLAVAGSFTPLWAQSFRRAGVEFNAMRTVNVPTGKSYTVVVTHFFHHGEVAADGRNVVVCTKSQKLVPSRILQIGPGDYCRLAFQTVEGTSAYEVFYGGTPPAGGTPPEKDAIPAWRNNDGLLLETRVYKECKLTSLESVREAFESSTRIGSDYVAEVFHAENPFAFKPEPFLSHYSGHLRIPSAGVYGFMTTSQDCSFLLIDDKLVVSAPGQHRAIHLARPGSRQDVQLSAGAHKFDYYHAAAGPEAVMAVAWEVSPKEVKPAKPQHIPSELFRAEAIGRLPAEWLTTRTARLVPDFQANLTGSVPLPDEEIPLVGAEFVDVSPRALTMKGKLIWDFGDGQTGEGSKVQHVYLHPGTYQVKLSIRYGGKPFEIVNRVHVDQPKVTDRGKFHKLDDYLPIVTSYDPKRLDATALRQLVLAFQAKGDEFQPRNPDEPPGRPRPRKARQKDKDADNAGPPPEETPEERAAARAEMIKYYTMATDAGKVAFLEDTAAAGDQELMSLARLVTPMARDVRGDAQLAYQIWLGAGRKVVHPRWKAECAIQAADVAINDLVNVPLAKKLLDAAEQFSKEKPPEPTADPSKSGSSARRDVLSAAGRAAEQAASALSAVRKHRILGDYYALSGDAKSARQAYALAGKSVTSTRNQVEQTAWRGAHSRSTEQFLKTGESDRAIAEIRAWQDEFPTEKIDGQLTLMYARYWAGRERYEQAIAQAEQLMTVAPDSPYIDQMLVLAAQCEAKRGKVDRAIATLQDLVKKYPGSPLVSTANETIAKLKSGEADEPKKTTPRRSQTSKEKRGAGSK